MSSQHLQLGHPRPGAERIRVVTIVLMALAFVFLTGRARSDSQPCSGTVDPAQGQARDIYHGVTVADPYRWLEHWDDPRVRAWSNEQSECARRYLDALPQASRLRERLGQVLTEQRSVTYSRPRRGGARLFALRRASGAQQPSLVWFEAESRQGEPRTLLDLIALDPTGGTSIDWYRPSPDGRLVAVSMSKGGAERGTLHLFDVQAGRETNETPIYNVNNATAGGDLLWSADSSGFFYTRYPQSAERSDSDLAFDQQVYYHRLGTKPQLDRHELDADLPRIAAIRLRGQAKTGRVLAWVQNGDSGEFRFFIREPKGRWQALGEFGQGLLEAQFGDGDDLYVVTRAGAPRGKVLHLSARDPDLRRAQVIIPESEGALGSSFYSPDSPTLTVLDGKLLLVYQMGGPTALRVFSRTGEILPSPETPEFSQLAAVTPLHPNEVLFTVESYSSPRRWTRYRLDSRQMQPAFEHAGGGEHGWRDAIVAREWARSRDGTRVPVNLIRLRGVETRGLLLTGYGGYGISMAPHFEPEVRVLLEQGVAYAVANLRGGGEYGADWHSQGRLTNKQNVFDDFIAAAESVMRRDDVPSDKLAITGRSNGGLLVAAVMTQRPDLAQAVVAHVGIFDSLRNELDANGAFNIPEFGTVKDPRQFAALYAYSPYHNVRAGVRYPNTLFMTGANDSRVNPMHSRKMAARLQHASASNAPVLLRTSENTGHGSGTPLAAQIEELTDAYAFVMNALALPYKPVARGHDPAQGSKH